LPTAQAEAEHRLCRLRRQPRHPAADKVYLLEEKAAPAS
jgi:hypothetical protein